MVVHDIDMQPVGKARDTCTFVCEPREVRGQDRRRDLRMHGVNLSSPKQREKHAVRVVTVRPQSEVRTWLRACPELVTVPQPRDGERHLACIKSVDMASLQHSVDDEFGLGQMRRARDIRDHPARAGTRDGSEEQFLLQRCELSDMSGLASPARLRSASEDTETRAGCIDEHSVEVTVDAEKLKPPG